MKLILITTLFASSAFANVCNDNGITTIWDKGAILCDLTGADGSDSFPIVVLDQSGSCEQKLNSAQGKTLVITKSIVDSGKTISTRLSIVDSNTRETLIAVGMHNENKNTASFYFKSSDGKVLNGICRPY